MDDSLYHNFLTVKYAIDIVLNAAATISTYTVLRSSGYH